jgi:hypothetical protein
MKTLKAYGLWCPYTKSVGVTNIYRTAKIVRDEVAFSSGDWARHFKEGYRVIPVTITYEEPEVKK